MGKKCDYCNKEIDEEVGITAFQEWLFCNEDCADKKHKKEQEKAP